MKTLEDLYQYGIKVLEKAGIKEAALDAWYLLEYITGVSKTFYYVDPKVSVSEENQKKYIEHIKKRSNHIPLQHIIGVQEFMGLDFYVNENVLIPRQETELLIEEIEARIHDKEIILDMCTGSGCILLSLLKRNLKLKGTGADISSAALEVARINNEKHQLDGRFIKSDLFENVEGKYDIIVSNPPYIKTSVIEELEEEVRLYDPYIALDGKEDGLYFYKEIIKRSPAYLNSNGILGLEIGFDQGKAVKNLMEQNGFINIEIKKDLAGLDRIAIGVYNNTEK